MKKIFLALAMFVVLLSVSSASTVSANARHVKKRADIVKVHTQYFKKANFVNVWFTGFKDAETIQYTLSYKSNGVAQGAVGTIEDSTFPNNGAITRKIQLATCSSNTCVEHKNITDLKLEVVITYEDGHVTTKSYDLGRRWGHDGDRSCDWD